MFTELKVNDFRALKDKTFQLGKYITMLAGWNATGKSTLLALLANSSELKQEEGKTYNDRQFRADFSEILKGSKAYDKSESNKLEVVWNDGNQCITKSFRTGWQKKKKDSDDERFRVIPKDKDTGTEEKFPFPVIYLGLSRLYPLGETEDTQFKSQNQSFKNDEDKAWFIEAHKKLLSLSEDITDITNIDFKGTKKNTSGITATSYDWKTNSSGQDNLSQILFAVLSFKNLKSEKGNAFKGGLLIIDEIEASLHPKAQEKIVEFLTKEARETGFQVIFTTHSLTIIEQFSRKTQNANDNVVSYYFTKANGQLEILKNAKFEDMKDDLMAALYEDDVPERIIVYTEDDEARWFLKKLLTGWLRKIQILNINISCQALIDLMNVEPTFIKRLVVFDGDLKATDTRRIKNNKSNYILLPVKNNAKQNPEKVIREFLFSNAADTYYQEQHALIPRLKREYFVENDVEPEGAKAERERYKEWFNKHKKLFDKSKIFSYWQKENQDLVNSFRADFKTKFNHIADKYNIPKID